jgi:hypothetical protein
MMVLFLIIILILLIVVTGVIWSKHNIQRDAIKKALEDEQIDKLLKLM